MSDSYFAGNNFSYPSYPNSITSTVSTGVLTLINSNKNSLLNSSECSDLIYTYKQIDDGMIMKIMV